MEQQLIQERLLEYRPKTSLTFISKGQVVKVAFADIIRISKRGPVVIIWTRDAKVETFLSFHELMRELPVNDFCQIHQSHIVCLHYIIRIFRRRILVDKAFILFSDYYRKLLNDHLKMVLNNCCDFYSNLNG